MRIFDHPYGGVRLSSPPTSLWWKYIPLCRWNCAAFGLPNHTQSRPTSLVQFSWSSINHAARRLQQYNLQLRTPTYYRTKFSLYFWSLGRWMASVEKSSQKSTNLWIELVGKRRQIRRDTVKYNRISVNMGKFDKFWRLSVFGTIFGQWGFSICRFVFDLLQRKKWQLDFGIKNWRKSRWILKESLPCQREPTNQTMKRDTWGL